MSTAAKGIDIDEWIETKIDPNTSTEDIIAALGAICYHNALEQDDYLKRIAAKTKRKLPLLWKTLRQVIKSKPKTVITEEEPPEPDEDGRPTIIVSVEELETNNQAIAALSSRKIFSRSGFLCALLDFKIKVLAHATLREELSAAARWVSKNKTNGGYERTIVPQSCVQAVYAREQWNGIPCIRGMVTVPMFRADGTVLTTPGYDPSSGLYYKPTLDFGEIPESPTRDEAMAAKDRLLDLACDFPFESEIHQAGWLAGVLSHFVMHMITSPVPMFVIDANIRGSGKGRLTELAARIVTGSTFPTMASNISDEELEKRITAKGLEACIAVLFDNVRCRIGGSVWETLATTRKWDGRDLGKSKSLLVDIDFVTWLNGNNVALNGDMPRRTVHIKLNSPEERPEDRRDFKYPKLLDYALEHRAELVRCCLTIVRAYISAGRPDQDCRLGSYEEWAAIVPSALMWLGMPDCTKSRLTFEKASGSDHNHLVALQDCWLRCFGAKSMLLRDVIRYADGISPLAYELKDLLSQFGFGGKEIKSKSLSNKIGQFRNRNVGGKMFKEMEPVNHTQTWALVNVDGSSLTYEADKPKVSETEELEGLAEAAEQSGLSFDDV